MVAANGSATVPGKLLGAVKASRGSSRRWLVVGAGVTCVGLVLIILAGTTGSVVLRVVGLLVTALGLRLLQPSIRSWTRRWRKLSAVVAFAACAAGVLLMASAFGMDSGQAVTAAGVAVALTVAGLVVLSASFKLSDWNAPAWFATTGPLLVPVGPLVAWALGVPMLLGLALALLGIAGYKSSLRGLCTDGVAAQRAAWIGVGMVIAGAAVLVWASRASSIERAGLGVYVVVLGVMAVTEGWAALRLRPLPPWAVFAIGAAVLLVGGYLVDFRLNTTGWATAAVVGALWLVGASFVVRGEVLIFVVAIGFACIWLVSDRFDEPPDDPIPGAASRILALGDSYISGEGSPTFFAGTNDKGSTKNECRRSPTAYPYLVAQRMGKGLDFFACSGAKAVELHEVAQMPTSPKDVVGGRPQLDNLGDDTAKAKIEVVLVSIGGNDALFGDIGKGCVLPGSCDELREVWLANLDQIGPRITAAYEAIKARLPTTPIVAIPYPVMISERGCGDSVMRGAEHAFLSEFLTVLNDRVRVSAMNAGVHFFQDGMFAFKDSGICQVDADKSSINVLNINPMQGRILDRISPRNWIHGSLHPTPRGHDAMATRLVDYLEKTLPTLPQPNPEPDKAAAFHLRNVGSDTPVLVDTREIPTDLDCPVVTSPGLAFATRVRLLDEGSPFVLDAKPESPVCYTGPDGNWLSAKPGVDQNVTLQDGVVRVRPIVPTAVGATQRILYDASDGGWSVRVVEFCSKLPGCPNDTGQWINSQLADAAREAALPVVLLFLGGWLATLGAASWWTTWSKKDPEPESTS